MDSFMQSIHASPLLLVVSVDVLVWEDDKKLIALFITHPTLRGRASRLFGSLVTPPHEHL